MRWPPVLILAYIAVGLQAGLSGQISIHGANPNFGLLAVVFISINAPRESAMLAGVIVGGMQDLATQQALGLFALSYGLVAWFVAGVQQVVYRDHPITHAVLTLIGGLITAAVVYVQGRVVSPRVSLSLLLGRAIYSAALAPVVVVVLQRLRALFGFTSGRRRQMVG